jgi:DGQHR domain-containing protein
MAKAKKRRKLRRKRQTRTPEQIAQRKQKSSIRSFFRRIAFTRIKIDGAQFQFKGRTGELDDIFIHDNVVVIAEYTVGSGTATHVTKKKILYDLIHNNQQEWIDFFQGVSSRFKDALTGSTYLSSQYRVCIAYFSTLGVSEEIESACPKVFFLDGTKFRYFEALSKTIFRSARFELFKYFHLRFEDIGSEVDSTSSSTKIFPGYVLPENFSSFPANFKVVSFYADPATLLKMSYVLRRDSWLDREGLYQRILLRSKIRKMRRYLTTDKRVFVNNIIVTLPRDTKLNDAADRSKNLEPKSLTKVERISVAVPFKYDTIGIVDGQHRIYCYHEGSDKFEAAIAKIRNRQNLLVTGIVFPDSYTEQKQRGFEAKLFLEINDTQTRTKADLKQSIELILNPNSTTAVAKAVVQRLSEKGPLSGLLQTNHFDPPELVKTSSIVSYGLKPLVRFDSPNSIYHLWNVPNKAQLLASQSPEMNALRDQYVTFCADKINDLLIAAKLAYGPDKWKVDKLAKDTILSPTGVNGLIVCLRLLIENNKVQSVQKYTTKLVGLDKFKFRAFKSSQWRALGEKLYHQFF